MMGKIVRCSSQWSSVVWEICKRMKPAANDFIRLRDYYKKKEGLGGV